MKKVEVTCMCCNTVHVISAAEVGKAFVALRKGRNTKEQLQRAGKLGAEIRWKSSIKTKKAKS